MKISKSGLFCALISLMSFAAIPLQSDEQGTLTARQIIERIQDHTGGQKSATWKGPTVDTFKAGDPDIPVTGIATTLSATMDVLEQAVAENANLIIAHEPTFYNHEDETAWLGDDPVLKRKLAYIQLHRLVIWRFHDKWHNSPDQPDGILKGMVSALGWEKFQSSSDPHVFKFPETTLENLARKIRIRLHIRALRVIGDPKLKITKVAFLPGASGREKQIKALRSDDIEVLVAGESAEWEGVLYVTDAIGQKKRKGLILMGHVPSEELGMKACADWLKSIVPEVQIHFIAAREPFWIPD